MLAVYTHEKCTVTSSAERCARSIEMTRKAGRRRGCYPRQLIIVCIIRVIPTHPTSSSSLRIDRSTNRKHPSSFFFIRPQPNAIPRVQTLSLSVSGPPRPEWDRRPRRLRRRHGLLIECSAPALCDRFPKLPFAGHVCVHRPGGRVCTPVVSCLACGGMRLAGTVHCPATLAEMNIPRSSV